MTTRSHGSNFIVAPSFPSLGDQLNLENLIEFEKYRNLNFYQGIQIIKVEQALNEI